ncbi:MAG: serine--tRNA ligase [Candidatus Levybacteria bacterium]|nr:serine--tRNA ligase [Candidatus Levybacteria bacterium]
MLDIKFIRENGETVQKGIRNKGSDVDIKHILETDSKQKELSLSVQKLREERNVAAREKNIEKGKKIKEKLEKEEHELRSLEDRIKELLLKIPNLPLKDVPIGDESRNEVIKKVGEIKKFDFEPRDHLTLGESLDIIDVTKAAKVSGSRFGYLKNEAVLLEFGLVQFVMEKLRDEGFIPLIPPVLIKREITEGLGYWQQGGNENYYFVRDYELSENEQVKSLDLYLAGTGEHSVVPMHKDEIFSEKDLPKRYVIFSSCFRREAGTYGKDTRGIFRVHQFDKIEMVSFVKPEDDRKEREKLQALVESMMQDLGLSYQLVRLATGDLSFPSAETIDVETWIPSQKRYRETHSISTTTDFQARRLNIKVQDKSEKKFVHILNGTAFAIGRTIIAILENYQEKDGSVMVPKILQKYIGKTVIKPKK